MRLAALILTFLFVSSSARLSAEPVLLADSFTPGANSEHPWQVIHGSAAPCLLVATKDWVSRSANPYAFQTDAAPEALAVAGESSWNNYRFSIAVRGTPGGTAGQLARYVDENNYLLVCLTFPDPAQPAAGKCSLLRRSAGQETICAERPVSVEPGQWYRLETSLDGPSVSVFLDGNLLLTGRDIAAAPGRVGLYARNARALFDDAEVVPANAARPYRPVPWMPDSMVNDPEMKHQWAHPAWPLVGTAQFPEAPRAVPLSCGRGDYFGDVRVALPVKNFAASAGTLSCIFTDAERNPKTGYVFTVTRQVGSTESVWSLSVRGEPCLEQRTAAETGPAEIVFRREGETISAQYNDRPIITRRCPGLRPPVLALQAQGTLAIDYSALRVETPNLLDYTFAQAPVDWYSAGGDWKICNRWTCTPNWNWLGGDSEGAAVFWNKNRFRGDITVTYSAAFRMNPAESGRYRVGTDLNISLCADGRNLNSGYSFIVGGWRNSRSAIMKGDAVVAESSAPGHLLTRFSDTSWSTYNWHHKWWNVRARKIGGLLQLYLDDQLVCQWRDPKPLVGGQAAIWTYGNLTSYPRLQIYYDRLADPAVSGPVRPTADLPPARPAADETKPDTPILLRQDFNNGACSWKNEAGREGFRFGLSGDTPDGSRYSLALTNPRAGGSLRTKITDRPFDAAQYPLLAFDYKIPPGLKLNLFVACGDRNGEIGFSGADFPSDTKMRIGQIADVRADNRWHRAESNLLTALRKAIPGPGPLPVTGIFLGIDTLDEYVLAGFHGNPAGLTALIDNVVVGRYTGRNLPRSLPEPILVRPEPGRPWSGRDIVIQCRSNGAGIVPSSLEMHCADEDLNADSPGVAYDPDTGRVTIDPGQAGLLFHDRQYVPVGIVALRDYLGNTISAPVSWQLRFSARADRYAPRPPEIVLPAAPLCVETFSQPGSEWPGRDGTVALRDPGRRVGGDYVLKLFAPRSQTSFGVAVRSQPFDAARFRSFSFDYCVPGDLRADWVFQTDEGARSVKFADNDGANRMGETGPVIRDGGWHQTGFDVFPMLRAAAPAARNYDVRELLLADTNYLGNTQRERYWLDNLRIDPVQNSRNGLAVRLLAADVSGIAGFSYTADLDPGTEAPTAVAADNPVVVLKECPGDIFYFHARAMDRAGNWSRTAHRKIIADGKCPTASRGAPADGSRSAGSLITVPLSDSGPAGVNPKSLALQVAGVTYDVTNPGLIYDSNTGLLTLNIERVKPRPLVFPDGARINVALKRAEDFAGNPAPVLPAWEFIEDYTLDQQPPPIADVRIEPYALFKYFSFEDNTGQMESATKDNPLQFSLGEGMPGFGRCVRCQSPSGGPLFCRMLNAPFDVRQYPYLVFSYRLPAGATLNLQILHYANEYLSLQFTGDAAQTRGKIEGAAADGNWHTAVVDLKTLVETRAKERGISYFTVNGVFLRSTGSSGLAPGAGIELDDVAVLKPAAGPAKVNWSATDATGIAGYSFLLDRTSGTQPEKAISGPASSAELPVPAGLSFFHLRARDGAGNWGPTCTYPLLNQ